MQRSVPERMDLPDIIAAAFMGCVRNWRVLAAIALPWALVNGGVNFALLRMLPDIPQGTQATAEQTRQFLRASAPLVLIAGIVWLFTHLALVHAALALTQGRTVAVGGALRAAVRTLPAALVPLLAFAGSTFLMLTIALAPVALWLIVNWLLAVQVIMDQGCDGVTALRRSRALVRGQWWHTCAVGLAVAVLYAFPGIVLTRVGAAVGSAGVLAVLAALAVLVGAPFLAFGHTRLYLDLRARKGETVRPPPERATL